MSTAYDFIEDFKRVIAAVLKPPQRFIEPRKLQDAVKKVAEKFEGEPKIPDSPDLNRVANLVWNLWRKKGRGGLQKIDYRLLRYIPWIFYEGERPFIRDTELTAALLDLLARKSRIAFSRLPYVYLLYCDLVIPGTEMLRRTIHDFLLVYTGKHSHLLKWKESLVFTFVPQGPCNTARWLVENEKSSDPITLLNALGLKGQLLAGRFINLVTSEVLHIVAARFPIHLEVLLKLLVDDAGRERFQDLLQETASQLIPLADNELFEEVKKRLKQFFLKYLSDPRLPEGRVKWKKVSEKARRIMTKWLSEEDIIFFFDILSKTVDKSTWKYRRAFWSAYLPHINATWIVLSTDVRAKIGAPAVQRINSGACGEFSGSNQGRSMLIIEMGGWVFLEWTHSGSCRIWRKQEFPLDLGRRYYQVSKIQKILYLCSHQEEHRSSENYKWQYKLSKWIFSELNLKPVKSFEVY